MRLLAVDFDMFAFLAAVARLPCWAQSTATRIETRSNLAQLMWKLPLIFVSWWHGDRAADYLERRVPVLPAERISILYSAGKTTVRSSIRSRFLSA